MTLAVCSVLPLVKLYGARVLSQPDIVIGSMMLVVHARRLSESREGVRAVNEIQNVESIEQNYSHIFYQTVTEIIKHSP